MRRWGVIAVGVLAALLLAVGVSRADDPPPTAPDAPSLVSAAPGNGIVTLTWTAPSDGGAAIGSYRVYRGTTGAATTFLDTVPAGTLTYPDSGVVNGTTYTYAVSAVNVVDEGLRSGELTATPAAKPGAPALDSATGGDGTVSLAWTPPASNGGVEITGYRIFRGTTAGGETFLADVGAVTTYSDTAAANGTAYFYEVAAVNAAGEGEKSNERSATPATVPGAPSLDSATGGDASVSLAWSTPTSDGGSSITGYGIYRGTGAGTKTLLVTVGVVAAYSDTTAVNGTTYAYEVAALNGVGESGRSNERSATPATTPGAPTLVSATFGDGSVALTWSPPAADGGAEVTGYRVYRGTSAGNEAPLTTVGAVTGYTDTGLTNGTTYFYEVAAVNRVDAGLRSNQLSETPSTVPGAPVLDSAAAGNAKVDLAWSAPDSTGGAAITAYSVYRGTSAGTETLLTTLGAVTSYTDSTAANGTTYFYEVAAVNRAGEGGRSNERSAKPQTVPGAPALADPVPGNVSVFLSWMPTSDGGAAISGYDVYRGTNGGAKTLVATLGLVTTYTDTDVLNGTSYAYEVAAVNAVGEGAHSVAKSAIPRTVPGAPTLDSAVNAVGSVTVNWSAPASDGGNAIAHYRIYRRANGSEEKVGEVGGGFTFTDPTGTPGTTYDYEVTAVNAAGEGPRSNAKQGTPLGLPGAPTLAPAQAGNVTVALTWTAPASTGGLPLTEYRLYRGVGASGSLTFFKSFAVAITGYTDNAVVNGTTYRYVVKAWNAIGEGPASVQQSATPATTPDAPSLTSATAGVGSVALVWTAPASTGGSAITGYRVYRGTSSGGEAPTPIKSLGVVTTYTDATAVAGTTYFYRVTAVNAVGEGPASNERSARPPTVASAPTLDAATAGKDSVVLAWSAPTANGGSAITGYKVYRGNASGSGSPLVTLGLVTSYTDTSVADGHTYYFRVVAINAVGESAFSNERSALVPVAPGAPTLDATFPANGSIALHWLTPFDGGTPITGYKVYRSVAGGSEAFLATTGAANDYTDHSVANGTLYTYRVTALNLVGESTKSNDRTAIPSAVMLGRPSWWNGPCDAASWNAKAGAAGWTGDGAHELGAAFLGVPVCGSGAGAPAIPWSRPGQPVQEWSSSELAFRFMAQIYGVQPYAATAEDVVRNYVPAAGGSLQRIQNGTAGAGPAPGDVISFDNPINDGYVAVVVTSSLDANGNGSLTLLSQNDTANGWRTIQVVGWTVRGFAQATPYAWLHDPAVRTEGVAATGRTTAEPSLDIAPRPAVPPFTLPPGTQRPPQP